MREEKLTRHPDDAATILSDYFRIKVYGANNMDGSNGPVKEMMITLPIYSVVREEDHTNYRKLFFDGKVIRVTGITREQNRFGIIDIPEPRFYAEDSNTLFAPDEEHRSSEDKFNTILDEYVA